MRGKTKSKLKKLGRQFETAKKNFNFSLHDPNNYTRARHARLTQFWLRIARLHFFDEKNPITENDSNGLAKLGNTNAETLLRAQMFPSLATHETLLRMLQGHKCCIRNTCFLV